MCKILIVEDDKTIATIVAEELERWGYNATVADDFSAVADTFSQLAPHLVLLDLSLPYRNGFYWCSEIRKVSHVPIVFISSSTDNMNMVTALHQGADDFISKPFDLSVLVAKVQALLRRSYQFAQRPPELPVCRGAVLNTGAMTLLVGEEEVELTRNEVRILQTLMEQKDRVVSRQELMRRLWDDEHFIDDNTLTVNINRLRKKLDGAGLSDFVVTKKGEGYLVPGGE